MTPSIGLDHQLTGTVLFSASEAEKSASFNLMR
jgi:hypothetical protein